MNNSTGKKKHLSFKGEEKKAKLRVTYVTVESQGRMRETTLRDVSWAALAMRPSLTMEQMNLDGVWILSYRLRHEWPPTAFQKHQTRSAFDAVFLDPE